MFLSDATLLFGATSMSKPLVTISIPTFNSARTLARCLRAVRKQTYKNIEVNVVDKVSKDKTVEIARKHGVRKIKIMDGSLLASRYEGAKMARGKYILILDSDQILEEDAIERAVEMCEGEGLDILVFEEFAYKTDTFLEKLFDLDRRLFNAVNNLSPFTGVILPRFFERKLLLAAYNKIPKEIFPHTGGPDHAIVYYEAWRISKKIGVLPKAVRHLEPSSLRQFLPKFFRWGYTSVDVRFGKYDTLMAQKERFRTGLFTQGLIVESLGSILLLILKGIPFKLGYYLGKIDRKLGFRRRY